MHTFKRKHIIVWYENIFWKDRPVYVTVTKITFPNNKIEWNFEWVVWPGKEYGDCCGQYTQIHSHPAIPEYIRKLWKKYHANGASVWTSKQDKYLAIIWPLTPNEEYIELEKAWLLIDGSHKYGSCIRYNANPNNKTINKFFESIKSVAHHWYLEENEHIN